MIHLTIPLSPVAKARPRVINGRAYTPTATASYERTVKLCAAHLTPLSGPIEAEIAFIFPRLKSATSTAREVKATRPDIDNLIKAILDGLNGLGFSDDGQVVQITASKWYAAADEEAHVEVKLCPFMREIQQRGGGERRARAEANRAEHRTAQAERDMEAAARRKVEREEKLKAVEAQRAEAKLNRARAFMDRWR